MDEAGNAGSPGGGHLQRLGHGVQVRRGQVAGLVLDLVHHGNQPASRLGTPLPLGALSVLLEQGRYLFA